MWSHDFGVNLGKGKAGEAPICISLVMVGGGGSAGRWNMMSDVGGGNDWDTLKSGGRNIKGKKKNQWRRSHTSCSQDLSPWQLSPPALTLTNWNSLCLCVSISFISCLKVNVPLNEIMHSAWVPLLRVSCLISSSFGRTLKRSTYFTKLPTQTLLTLDFNTPLGHNIMYLVRSGLGVHCQTRHDSEVRDGEC